MSSGGHAVTSISSGTTVVLTASVSTGATGIKTGQVNFCDATASYCTDIHLLGTAQLTSTGTASITLRPSIGSYHYKAIFAGTVAYSASISSTSTLSVTGTYPSVTNIVQSGSSGDYGLTAIVSASAKSLPGPIGKISFLDTSNSNAVLATADLGDAAIAPTLVNVSNPQVGNGPGPVVAADFNGDGNLDLAVGVNEIGHSVSILLGDGAGNFAEVTGNPITAQGAPVLVQDLNGDGILDLVLASSTNSSITILLGNGDGTFRESSGSPFVSTYGVSPIVVADFNGDGIPDLVAAGGYYLAVFLGNGDGTFTPMSINSSPTAQADSINSMAVGDLNGDGIPDIATLDLSDESVSIFLGIGDGSFGHASTIPISTLSAGSSTSLAIGDFNGDGKLDLVVPVYDNNGSILVLLGNGDGTFQSTPASPIAVEAFPNRVAVGDFNGDGIPDILVAAQSSGTTLNILLGKGDGTFSQMSVGSAQLPCCSNTVLGDFNGDGVTDIASSDFYSSSVQMLFEEHIIQATAAVTGVSPNGPGTHMVVASYPGDTNFGSSISSATSLQAQAAAPVFNPAGGIYPSAQTITLSDSSSSVTIYYTKDGSTPGPSSTVYSSPIMVSGSETVKAIATGTGYLPSSVATAVYAIVPPPQLTSLSPPFTSVGGASFTLTLNGSQFVPATTIYWGSTAVATHYIGAAQLTAQITSSEIATSGITAITVQNPTSAGGTSNSLQFEVDSGGEGSLPTFTTATATVAAGSSATYQVTLPSAATAATVSCLNLPTGATCSYSATTSTLTITTSSTTPSGTYEITTVFNETLPGATSALAALLLLVPFLGTRQKRIKVNLSWMVFFGFVLAIGSVVGCAGGSGGGSSPSSHQVTGSSSVTLIVK